MPTLKPLLPSDQQVRRRTFATLRQILSASDAITGEAAERLKRIAQLFGVEDMDWTRVEGNWKRMKGRVKERWGKLTDDDLTAIAGRRDQLEGMIQERYGYAKERARNEIEDWYRSMGI